MFWVRVPGALFTGVIIHCRRRELQYFFFFLTIADVLCGWVEGRCSTSRIMQLRRLVAAKERVGNSDFILSNP